MLIPDFCYNYGNFACCIALLRGGPEKHTPLRVPAIVS